LEDPGVAIQLIALFVLLLLSSFFSSAETALTTVNKHRIRSLADQNIRHAKTVAALIEDPKRMLSAILIGNNIVNLSASSIATSLAIEKFDSFGAGLATGILTFLILVFGEITPKSLATFYSEKLALIYSPIIWGMSRILTPIIFILNRISYLVLFILRVDPNKKLDTMTEHELRTILDVSHEEGVLEQEERNMITNVVDFGDSLAKDVMVPRINMAFADVDMSYDELRELFRKERYSRLPVYSETRDNVLGIINLKDVFFHADAEDFKIADYLRDAYFTYEFKKTSELLNEMRKKSMPIAIVLDEYGAVAGLISFEDLLEEIVGEIRDEYDDDEEDIIQKISDTEYMIDGMTRIEDINELFGLQLESEDYDSIAGHIMNRLEHLPGEGESVVDGNVTFIVASMNRNRLDKVHVLIASDTTKDQEES